MSGMIVLCLKDQKNLIKALLSFSKLELGVTTKKLVAPSYKE